MFIPGRIEFLGKHTDYCGGHSIVCAIDRGFTANIRERVDPVVSLENPDTGETVSFDLAARSAPQRGHWINYAIEVGRRLTQNFGALHGADISFKSDLPMAAGLSSSSALVIMVYATLERANDLRGSQAFKTNIRTDLDLAEYLGCIENGQTFRDLTGSTGVGTFGGSQDHAAILLGKTDSLSRFSFSPPTHEADFVFPDEYTFVIASSGVIAEKTGAALDKYNRLSRMVSDVTSALGVDGSLEHAISAEGIDAIRDAIKKGESGYSTADLLARVEQFYIENFEIIPAVCELLAAGEFGNIGDLVDASQQTAERFLGNQIAETSFLQRSAREFGALAASAFGAGFGGSVYAVVTASDAEKFMQEWRRVYERHFPQHARASEFFVTRPSECEMT